MGEMKIGRSPTPAFKPLAGPPKSQAPAKAEKSLGPRPAYPPPKPPAKSPGVDVSTPAARSRSLATIADASTRPRTGAELQGLARSGPGQAVKNGAALVEAMHDKRFAETLAKFNPSMGQRLMQACGKSEGSVDGGRFKKNAARMVPLVNIGVYGKDAVRAQQHKKALDGIARHAEANGNQLAQQLAQTLGGHEKSKRNTQMISGAVAVASTAASVIPGAQAAPALTGAAASLSTNLGALGVQYTAAAAIDSGLRTVGGTVAGTAASTAQDLAISAADRHGESVGKAKLGSGYGKLKVTTRVDSEGQVKMETEMGYQAARALVNYLGPAQGMAESPASPRMQLRRALGAVDDDKTYRVAEDKKQQRKAAAAADVHDGRKDYLQMFFDIGVKGADLPYQPF